MKRSRLPDRTTPLRRTELRRSPTPAEDTRPSSAGPVKPRKSPAQPGMAHGRKLVYARSGGWCEVRIPGVCLGRGMSWHHRKNRSQGGTWAASNGLHCCGDGVTGCHGALTNPPRGRKAEFQGSGWIVPSHADPAEVPVWIAGRLVYLTDSGDLLAATKGEKSA